MKKIRTVIPSAWDKPTNTTEQIIIVNIIVISIFLFIIAKLSQAQSNFNSVGWAEIALIPTFSNFNSVIGRTTKVVFWAPPSLMTSVPAVN